MPLGQFYPYEVGFDFILFLTMEKDIHSFGHFRSFLEPPCLPTLTCLIIFIDVQYLEQLA